MSALSKLGTYLVGAEAVLVVERVGLREDGPHGVHADDLEVRQPLLQLAADAGERAARARRDDEVVDLAVRLRQQLLRRVVVVRCAVRNGRSIDRWMD